MLMSGLEKPSTGSIIFQGQDISKLVRKKYSNKKRKNWSSIPAVLFNSKLYST